MWHYNGLESVCTNAQGDMKKLKAQMLIACFDWFLRRLIAGAFVSEVSIHSLSCENCNLHITTRGVPNFRGSVAIALDCFTFLYAFWIIWTAYFSYLIFLYIWTALRHRGILSWFYLQFKTQVKQKILAWCETFSKT